VETEQTNRRRQQNARVSENGQRIAGERRLGKNIKLNEIVAGSHVRKYLFV